MSSQLYRLMDTHAHTLCPSGILFYSYVRTLGELRQIDQPESASMRIGRATEEAPWVSLLGPRFENLETYFLVLTQSLVGIDYI
ncbi:hypothetical protein BLOT_005573 [Blomia tropicalis]|nr:hypothetical protein BLOT_005573 [Blomia tropicalis]